MACLASLVGTYRHVSLLGPPAVPTQITAGTSRRWVLLWQGVVIVLWMTLTTTVAWGVVSSVVT
ncbi:hypothetical protein [Cryptosporangium sp. NPDC048952]|uniref:hypothetical protein n=1 Tax=Cryptosporangium sp. NPDC048952 TaxID=3363961 RepID=UPI0037217306